MSCCCNVICDSAQRRWRWKDDDDDDDKDKQKVQIFPLEGHQQAHSTLCTLLVEFPTNVIGKVQVGLSLLRSMTVNALSPPTCILRISSTRKHSPLIQNILLQFIFVTWRHRASQQTKQPSSHTCLYLPYEHKRWIENRFHRVRQHCCNSRTRLNLTPWRHNQ
jgi:hypothetical protein